VRFRLIFALNQRMRILLYTETALPKLGGQEMVVDALARQFTTEGHDVLVLAPHPRLPLRANDRHLPYRVKRHPRFYSTHRLVSWYRWYLLRACRQFKPDVIHCHSIYPCGYVAACCRVQLGIPIVLTSHGGDVNENNPRIRKPSVPARYDAALAAADRLISISRFTRDGFIRLGADPSRIVDIPNGVDPAPFAARVSRPAEIDARIIPSRYFLFIGRLTQRKGVDTLLRAVALRSNLTVVIAGDGDERPALQSLATQLKIDGRVIFVGSTRGDAKLYLFQNALCTVIPSRWWEAFPLTVLESFASARPVIATRVPGLEDLIDDHATGRLVAPDTPAELANTMSELWNEPDRAASMGQNAFAKVCHFTWQSVAARHIQLYQSLPAAIASPTSRPPHTPIQPNAS
jgi:teichuronic acid biosynthesis glycosyltransferase TuaC